MSKEKRPKIADVVPLFGRDEMNLVEIPFGPITKTTAKTLEVEHEAYDRQLKRYVTRRLLMTGTDAFGLPQPIDDQVLVGLKALTSEAKFQSRRVEFSRYKLCKAIGWPTDGRSYRRIEESLDRIASTTLKFKDSWWDKGETEWKSQTFTLIGSVQLCSRDQLDRARAKNPAAKIQLCSFEWSEVIWKSFIDGHIRKLDMQMFRRIRSGRRREVAVRLYRVIDKRLYKRSACDFDLERLCKGIIGLSESYCPSEMKRVIGRAGDWLIECGFIDAMKFRPDAKTGELQVVFWKARKVRVIDADLDAATLRLPTAKRQLLSQFDAMPKAKREKLLAAAIAYCRKHHPEHVQGYERNVSCEGESSRAYTELILVAFWKGTKRRRVSAA